MTDLEAIELRHSRRGYLDTPMEAGSIRILRDAIEEYNKISGLSIQLVEEGREAFKGFTMGYGMFSGVRSYIAIVGKKSDKNLLEKAGYYGEKLVLTATKLGLGTCWVGGTFNKRRTACTIHEGETLAILITIGNVEEKKGLRENMFYKLAHRGTKSIEQMYTAEGDVPDWFLQGMRAVQKAPSAVNLQPVLFHYLMGIITADVKETLHMQLVDLGIAKLHFEIGAGRGKFVFGNGATFLQ
jgi:nitroreductase